jgi:5-dehydro-2-deoxygluconokinase
MLLDGTYGREAMFRAADHDFWVGRPVEKPGSRPLEAQIDGSAAIGAKLPEWPLAQTVKVLCFYHPDDPAELKLQQEAELRRVFDACRTVGRELLVEIIAGKHGPLGDDTVASVLDRLYTLGIKPDWWKLEPQPTATAWGAIEASILAHDPLCRGVLMLGLEAPEAELARAFALAAPFAAVKGFAVGRTIFADPARDWLAGKIDDATAVDRMADRFGSLVAVWQQARRG